MSKQTVYEWSNRNIDYNVNVACGHGVWVVGWGVGVCGAEREKGDLA